MFEYSVSELEKGNHTFISPKGNSMEPLIKSGDMVELKPAKDVELNVDDIVLVKVRKRMFIHKISAIDKSKSRVQISNNKGHINGWTSRNNVFGVRVK